MSYTKSELTEAKRQISSTLSKTIAVEESLRNKEHPDRYKSQITLANRRIEAFKISLALIDKELASTKEEASE